MSKSLFARTRQRRTARLRTQRREQLCNPIIEYLMSRENEAETLDEQDHYKFCRRVVSLALDAWPEPFVAAFYYHYGRHPDKLIPEWLQREEYAKTLGPSLADLLQDPLFLVPDYDPRIPIRRPASGLAPVYQMPASGWPDQQDTLRDPQEEERLSPPRIPRKSPQGLARTGGPMVICTECQNPAGQGKCLCAHHLRRARAAVKRSQARRRLLQQAQALAMPKVAGLARLLAYGDEQTAA